MIVLLSLFISYSTNILYFLFVLLTYHSRSALIRETYQQNSTEAQVDSPRVQEARPVVSLRSVGREHRGGRF